MGLKKFFKKRAIIHNPFLGAKNVMDRQKRHAASDKAEAMISADRAANQSQLDQTMSEYGQIPQKLRDQYLANAKQAGTYGNTSEFNSGLESEVTAGARGARAMMVGRINALRKALGNNEEFKPEGYQMTQANQTDQALGLNPAKDEQSAVSAAPPSEDSGSTGEELVDKENEGPRTGNAVTGAQNKARLAALRKAQ